jgi:hypothetical protein
MLPRSLVAWLGFSLLVFGVAYVTQASEFDVMYIALAAFFSIPFAVSVYFGSLGTDSDGSFSYPSVGVCMLGSWIATIAPSLIVEVPESRLLFNYTELGLTWARALFFSWCLVFAIAVAAPYENPMRVTLRRTDFFSLLSAALVVLTALVSLGLFSNYQASAVRSSYEPGSPRAILKLIGGPLPPLLPALCALSYARAKSSALKWASAACFLGSWVALFLSTSRSAIVIAILICLCLARKLALRLHVTLMVGLLSTLPILFLLMFSYRQMLSDSEQGATSVSAYFSIAADSTSNVVQDVNARTEAITALSENMRSRMWYGQQLSASADEWLDHGSTWHGSLVAGLIRVAPTFLIPSKNEVADELEFETLLVRSGRFPPIDLGPMPWQQWLFELGLPGLFLGALLYAGLARVIDRRLSNSRSVYEVAFWLAIFITISGSEHTTDGIVLTARIIGVFVVVVAAFAFILSMFIRATPAERELASS